MLERQKLNSRFDTRVDRVSSFFGYLSLYNEVCYIREYTKTFVGNNLPHFVLSQKRNEI